jgi:mRNA interferase RelE/StbE
MTFEVKYLPEVVKKQIPKLSQANRQRIQKVIEKRLAIDPIAYGRPLKYSLKGLRRLRVDDYRVIYKIDDIDHVVIIVKIGHRKEIYE